MKPLVNSIIIASFCIYSQNYAAEIAAPPATPSPAPASIAEDNTMLKTAKKIGFVTCQPAVAKISNFITDKNAPHGSNDIWNSKNTDDSGLSSVIERSYIDGSILSSVTVVHTKADQCFTEYEKVFYLDKPCLAAAQNDFKQDHYHSELKKNVTYLKGNGADIYLMNAGTGCLVMRKEVLMDGNTQ